MGRWDICDHATIDGKHYDGLEFESIRRAHNADVDAYEARIAELESMLASEVQDNAKLRAREVGDEAGNVLQEIADLRDELARVKAESLRVVKNPTGGKKPRPEFVAYLFFEGSHVRLERWETEE